MNGKIIPSFKRALEILGGAQTLSKPEISARLGLPSTTVHEQVNTLLAGGCLEKDESHPNRYRLGIRVFELGSAFAARLDPSQECLRAAQEVSRACDETVQMAVREGQDVVFIIRVDSSRTLRLVSAVGTRLPAHCTAVGKMLLASLSDQEFATLYKGQRRLVGLTSRSITSVTQPVRELSETRKRGYAYDDCESNEDARCVAAMVYDRDGTPYAAMSITVPVTRMDLKGIIELAQAVQADVKKLSHRLGYRYKLAGIERRNGPAVDDRQSAASLRWSSSCNLKHLAHPNPISLPRFSAVMDCAVTASL